MKLTDFKEGEWFEHPRLPGRYTFKNSAFYSPHNRIATYIVLEFLLSDDWRPAIVYETFADIKMRINQGTCIYTKEYDEHTYFWHDEDKNIRCETDIESTFPEWEMLEYLINNMDRPIWYTKD